MELDRQVWLGALEMGKKQTKNKKTKVEKQEKDFMPGAETEDQFDKVLSLLSQWMKAGIVTVNVDVDGDIAFELPREMNKLLETQVPSDLTHEKVRSIIRSEIPALVDAGLRKNPEQALRLGMPEKLHGQIDTMVKRSQKAINSLVDRALKERIMLRKTTTGYVLDDIASIQSTYHVEAEKGERINVPFISLELAFAKPRSGFVFSLSPRERVMSASRKDEIRVTLDLHKDDIKDLIQKLKKIEEETSTKGD
jgi:hypothetical protein